jgi:DNA-binding MarR family transcriptional regulator/N-acetylglutamate synthase-like GNAT family acetyltransferase
MPEITLDRRIEAVRSFNRFYTKQVGVLQEGLLESDFSLTEVRVLYELAHRENLTASEILKDLGLDRGYLSRILASFEQRGLIAKKTSKTDSRQCDLSLAARGRKALAPLEKRSQKEVAAMLGTLPAPEQNRLVQAMQTIQSLLGPKAENKVSYILRPHRPGDMGWIIHRHGVLYSQEYGWDESFEGLVAEIAAKFIQNFDSRRERCWIAEKDGGIIGCVFLVQQSEEVAKLRLLLVEPSARGLGIGKRLVQECIRFAREAGYQTMTLWTNDILHAARHIYQQEGFRLVQQERHHSFGHDLVGQNWELTLRTEK